MKKELEIDCVSELLHTVSEDMKGDAYLAEIIFKDNIIVTKESFPTAENNPKNLVLKAGQHSTLCEDGVTLRALITGYPVIIRNKNGEAHSIRVDIIPLLTVSEDKMQAMITLDPPLQEHRHLTRKLSKPFYNKRGSPMASTRLGF